MRNDDATSLRALLAAATDGPWTPGNSTISWWIDAPSNKSRCWVIGHLGADTWHDKEARKRALADRDLIIWLRNNAEILIFDEPTKGVDVKAKTDLFTLIDHLAREGKGIIYASGEFAELVGLCDRICVLWDGHIVAELEGRDASEETLLLYSTGGTPA